MLEATVLVRIDDATALTTLTTRSIRIQLPDVKPGAIDDAVAAALAAAVVDRKMTLA